MSCLGTPFLRVSTLLALWTLLGVSSKTIHSQKIGLAKVREFLLWGILDYVEITYCGITRQNRLSRIHHELWVMAAIEIYNNYKLKKSYRFERWALF